MKKMIIILVTGLILSGCTTYHYYTKTFNDYLDTVTTYTTYASSASAFDDQCELVEAKLKYYDALFDQYHSSSINNVYTINHNAGKKAVKVDNDLIDLLNLTLDRYKRISKEVKITLGPVLSLWHSEREKALKHNGEGDIPSQKALKKANKYTSIEELSINKKKKTVYLKNKKASVDVGAVAKGYTMAKIRQALIDDKVDNFLLNGGGNVVSYGKRKVKNDDVEYLNECKEKYCVGIASPQDGNFDDQRSYEAILVADGKSIVTSGDYQRYYTHNNKRYSHLISPETLMPATYMRSVSVVTTDSSLADFLSTALFMMSYQKGKKLVESLEGVEAIWLLNDGSIRYSSGLKDGTHFYVIDKKRLK